MAVIYMRKLEAEPTTYEFQFTKLTKGVNLQVYDWILSQIGASDTILEVGCGPGTLSLKMAHQARSVTAIDKNPQMIALAREKITSELTSKLSFEEGSAIKLERTASSYDIIVSTFLLFELRPFEQQIFLRNAWNLLKPGGKLIFADEFIPKGFWRLGFFVKRWWYKRKLKRHRTGLTHPLKWFANYIEPLGFKIVSEKQWGHGSIRALSLQKRSDIPEPGYYRPTTRSFRGIKANLRIMRCLFTGQMDHVAIEPGIYSSGNPTPESPVIVTANYDYTYIRVMKDLEGIDAWVLCVDSRGINVWCAARGGDFGNDQLIEAVEATGLNQLTTKKTLLLPQLAAGGVAAPLLEKADFPFNIKYGPVWSKDLPQYLRDQPIRKPEQMKLANFTISHRIRAGITHTTFLLRRIFLPIAILLLLLFLPLSIYGFNRVWFIGDLLLGVIITNMLLAIIFPITDFTRRFLLKGAVIGTINSFILGVLAFFVHHSLIFALLNLTLLFWLGIFSTMSFSGYTMATSPREIAEEYPLFKIFNGVSLILGIILSTLGLLLI